MLSRAHKGMDSIRHVLDNLCGLFLSAGYQRLGNVHDAIIAKPVLIDILGFVQSIGIEEDGCGGAQGWSLVA